MPHDDEKPDILQQLGTAIGGLPGHAELNGISIAMGIDSFYMLDTGGGDMISHPAYIDLDALHADGTDPAGSAITIENIYKALLVMDGVPDALEAIDSDQLGAPKSDAKLKKEARNHGYEDVNTYKNALKTKAISKILKRTTVVGSILISMFKSLLYYFRDDINEIIRDYLRGDSDIERRGRKLTNFEVLFKEDIARTETTGTRERSYLAALIAFETDPRLDGISEGDSTGAAPGGDGDALFDMEDLR